MSYPHGWGNSPPPSPPPFPPSNSDGPHHLNGHAYLLGAVFERTNAILLEIGWVKQRLENGAAQFQSHEARLCRVEEKVAHAMKPKETDEDIPKWERTLKRWAAFLVPAGIFAGTGQLAAALEWAKLLR